MFLVVLMDTSLNKVFALNALKIVPNVLMLKHALNVVKVF